ncbi:hypothetical protein LCGC14_0999750 [marine sediment metagenome]|uniref:Uncharacterized protein n=1 Tax=marine sediment metagenome TaxID=412755 RepID=A0A0F9N3C9_9ZZZZ
MSELEIEKKPQDIDVLDGKLTDWKSIEIKDTDMILYYNTFSDEKVAEETRDGFRFYCIESLSWKTVTKEILNCNCVFHGTAYFDGIRHLYFGDHQTDNFGYHYYPSMNILILALKELKKLEKKYCRED